MNYTVLIHVLNEHGMKNDLEQMVGLNDLSIDESLKLNINNAIEDHEKEMI